MSPPLQLSIVIFVCAALVVTAAPAEEPASPDANASARALALGHRGLSHYAEGRFVLAERDFSAAEGLTHSPVFLLYQARAQRELGHLIHARELFQKCALEQITPATPPAWKSAIDDAAKELELIEESIASLVIIIEGDVAFPVTLRAGKRTLEVEQLEASWELDPGAHTIVARDAAGTEISLQVLLRRGDRESLLSLSFPKILPFESASSAQRGRSGSDAAVLLDIAVPGAPERPYRSGAHAAFLLGGSAWIFSAVAGTVAWSEAQRIKKNCVGTSCRPEDAPYADKARLWANLSTAGFVAGAVGVGAGIGLLFYPTQGGGQLEVALDF